MKKIIRTPCNCICHRAQGITHIVACCNDNGYNTYEVEDKYTSQETVDFLNKMQRGDCYHPYTCCGFEGCMRPKEYNEGILIATENGYVCPCGKYKQPYR